VLLSGRLRLNAKNIIIDWKSLPVANTLAYWDHLKVAKKIKCCENGPWKATNVEMEKKIKKQKFESQVKSQ